MTSAVTAMIQLEIVYFSYFYSSKLYIAHFGRLESFEVLCCKELNIKDYFLGSSILKYCLVSILLRFINFAQYQILIKLLHFTRDFAEEIMNAKICKIYRIHFLYIYYIYMYIYVHSSLQYILQSVII